MVTATVSMRGGWPLRAILLLCTSLLYGGWAAAQSLTPSWQVSLKGAFNQAPLVRDGLVFVVPENGSLTALRLRDGARVWHRKASDVWDRGYSWHDGKLLVCLKDASVAALDPANGREIWRRHLGIHCQRPAVDHQGLLLVSTTHVGPGLPNKPLRGATLFALDLKTGKLHWRFVSETFLLQTATVDEGRVFVGGSYIDPHFEGEEGGAAYYHALDLHSGKPLWRVPSVDGLPKTLYAHKGLLAYVAYEDFVQVMDARDGRMLWRKDTENWLPAIVGLEDTLYLGTANTFVHAWDLRDGRTLWRYNMPGQAFEYLLVKPTIEGDTLYFMSQKGRVFALDRLQGQARWSAETGRVSRIDPAFAEGHVVIGDIEGQVTAFRLEPPKNASLSPQG